MQTPPTVRLRSLIRRTLGVTICLGVPAALLFSLALGPRSSPAAAPQSSIPAIAAAALVSVAAVIGVLNLYLSFVRPWNYRRRHGTDFGYRFVSGVPVLGTLLLAPVVLLSLGTPYLAACGLLVSMIDTGGLPWFLIMTWRDRSLWDR